MRAEDVGAKEVKWAAYHVITMDAGARDLLIAGYLE